MGITLHLKSIAPETLEILKQDSDRVDIFYEAEWLSKEKLVSKFGDSIHLDRFLAEWETANLDLHKYYSEITYILAGYIPDYRYRHLALPELQARAELMQEDSFMEFLVIENSQWDGLPLVNALFAGVGIGRERATWYQTPEQVGDILDGLLWICDDGFRDRCKREAELDRVEDWIDWEEEEMADWLTDYYDRLLYYYQLAARNDRAMLIDLNI